MTEDAVVRKWYLTEVRDEPTGFHGEPLHHIENELSLLIRTAWVYGVREDIFPVIHDRAGHGFTPDEFRAMLIESIIDLAFMSRATLTFLFRGPSYINQVLDALHYRAGRQADKVIADYHASRISHIMVTEVRHGDYRNIRASAMAEIEWLAAAPIGALATAMDVPREQVQRQLQRAARALPGPVPLTMDYDIFPPEIEVTKLTWSEAKSHNADLYHADAETRLAKFVTITANEAVTWSVQELDYTDDNLDTPRTGVWTTVDQVLLRPLAPGRVLHVRATDAAGNQTYALASHPPADPPPGPSLPEDETGDDGGGR